MRGLNFGDLSASFDQVIRVGICSYPHIKCPRLALDDWQQIRRYQSELNKVAFVPGATLFLTCGQELVTNILLKRLRREKVTTVWLSRTFVQNLYDLRFSYIYWLYYNLINLFYGAVLMDVFPLDVFGDGKYQVYWQPRQNPFSHRFYMVDQTNAQQLAPNEIYRPYYFPSRHRNGTREKIVVFGDDSPDSRPQVQTTFRLRFNQLLDLVRTKHAGARLVYRHHPGSPLGDHYDLRGFEIERQAIAEAMFSNDASISTVYSIWSEATVHAPFFGIRGFFLYYLFDDIAIPRSLKRHMDLSREIYKQEPRMFLRSVEDWMDGENDYPVDFDSRRILGSVGAMLDYLHL